MMAKRKYDDVEEEDSISDDLLNQHYDELEKQQYGGEISDDQLNELDQPTIGPTTIGCPQYRLGCGTIRWCSL